MSELGFDIKIKGGESHLRCGSAGTDKPVRHWIELLHDALQ